MLTAQVLIINTWARVRPRLVHLRDDDRGQVYAEFLWVALGIAVVIAIATILYLKFKASAESIPTNAPGIPASGGNAPVTSPSG